MGMLIPYLLVALFILNIIFAAFIIFLERRNASATWAWLMVLIFMPIAGFIIYLIFGQNLSRRRIFKWAGKEKIGIKEAVAHQLQALRTRTFIFKNPDIYRYQHMIYMNLRNDDAVYTENNHIDIYIDGEKKFNALMQDIDHARDHIHLLYYILRSDQLGHKLVEKLTQKAKEGVEVRLLYDHMGSRGLKKSLFKDLRAAGGRVEAFFPHLHWNFRNHRKLAIIDGKTGYIGGFNIGDEYLGLDKIFGYWRDTHLRVQGDAVHTMQTRFILDWNQASAHHEIIYEDRLFPEIPDYGDSGIQVVSSGPDSHWEQIKNAYVKMILEAREYVYIQTPYFIPDDTLLDALKIAALSGVDVRLMVPNKPDHMFVYWATYSNIGELLKAGAKVFIYQNGFIHAKTIVTDGRISSVGTANTDFRSFRLNFEVNAFIYDEKPSQALKEIFEKDMNLSTELTNAQYLKRSYWIRFKEAIARLLSPIL